jgi:dihydroorotate dehydrogenase electron transfer subunit
MNVFRNRVLENNLVSNNIYELKVEFEGDVSPGQFFMLKTLDNSFLLPRPISIFDYNCSVLSFLYRIEGSGTKAIRNLKKHDTIQIFGPLGNGFDISSYKGKIAIVGGGIGIAPLFYLSKKVGNRADVYLGFRDEVYMVNNFKNYCNKITITTENGVMGEKGYITDYINYQDYDIVVACGPEVMLNKVIKSCKEIQIKCYVSLERRMACGLGACLGCTVQKKHGNRRACKDGPVFSADELMIGEVK